jgi:hypothetical protein
MDLKSRPIIWPPISPDLTPLDFCMWEYVKIVHAERIRDLRHFRERIYTSQIPQTCSVVPATRTYTAWMSAWLQRVLTLRLVKDIKKLTEHFQILQAVICSVVYFKSLCILKRGSLYSMTLCLYNSTQRNRTMQSLQIGTLFLTRLTI